MIGSRNGFNGWETQACRGIVVIGNLKPASAATRLLDPATAASLAYFMYPLANARVVNAGEVPPEALGVRAADDRTP